MLEIIKYLGAVSVGVFLFATYDGLKSKLGKKPKRAELNALDRLEAWQRRGARSITIEHDHGEFIVVLHAVSGEEAHREIGIGSTIANAAHDALGRAGE